MLKIFRQLFSKTRALPLLCVSVFLSVIGLPLKAQELSFEVVCELPDLEFYESKFGKFTTLHYYDPSDLSHHNYVRHSDADCWLWHQGQVVPHINDFLVNERDRVIPNIAMNTQVTGLNSTRLNPGGIEFVVHVPFVEVEAVEKSIERQSPFCAQSEDSGNVVCTPEVVAWTRSSFVQVSILLEQVGSADCILILNDPICGENYD